MGFRFRKSIKAGPVRINLSKSGIGYSVGGKGFRYTKKANGGTRTTYSIPGTGLSYVSETGAKKHSNSNSKQIATPSAIVPVSTETETESLSGYCKHCYRMLDKGTIICPVCGKSQAEQVAPPPSNKKAVWWLVCFIVGLCCINSSPLIALLCLSIAIYLSIGMIKDKKSAQNEPAQGKFFVPTASSPKESIDASTSTFSNSTTSTPTTKRRNTYVINPQTMVIHRRTCPHAQKVDIHYTDSKSAAISVGYRPCKHCKP